jgi:hypothetical protein
MKTTLPITLIALSLAPATAVASPITFGHRLDHEPSNSSPAHNCKEDGSQDPTPACTRIPNDGDGGGAVAAGMTARPRHAGLLYLLALAAGALCGYVDLITAEVFFVALLVLSLSMLFGVLWPRRSWLLGMLVGAGVPAAHIVARLVQFTTELPNHIVTSLLLLVPGAVGGIGGGVMRYLFARLREG